jgi:hypothetical protein
MTSASAKRVLAAFALAVGAAGFVLFRNYNDNEMSVYVAFVQTYSAFPQMKDAAFMGSVSTCGASRASIPDAGLLHALNDASSAGTEPRSLEKLSNIANVIKSDVAKDAQSKSILVTGARATYIYRMSRVGFNSDHSRAVMCVETDVSGFVVMFEKADGPFWRETRRVGVWII